MEAVKQVYDFMDKAGVYFLATVDGDQPHVRAYGTSLLFEGQLYIMAFNHTAAIDQLRANPKAEIAAFKGKQRQDIKDAMAAKMPSLKDAAGERNQNFIMLRVTDATATISDLAGHSDTCTF